MLKLALRLLFTLALGLCLNSVGECQEKSELKSKATRSLTTETFQYTRNFFDSTDVYEELYQLDNADLKQQVNVADDPKFADDRKLISDQLTKQLRDAADPIFRLPNHATFNVKGWKVHLNDELWREHPARTKTMLTLLKAQLERVLNSVPEKSLHQIQAVPIWINPTPAGEQASAAFHPSRRWLEAHDRNPDMAKCVELTNVLIFEFEDTRMPMLMLHELAHAYHNLVLDFRNPQIRAAYDSAKESGTYDEVKRFNGRKIVMDKAYAMNNEKEYFAESSEAYFGKNDFFPFTRDELQSQDPKMFKLVRDLWGDSIPLPSQ